MNDFGGRAIHKSGEQREQSSSGRRRTQSKRRALKRTSCVAARPRGRGGAVAQKPDEIARLKQAAESATVELQQARDKANALESELAQARRDVETKAALLREGRDEAAQLKQAAESSSAELQQARENPRHSKAKYPWHENSSRPRRRKR